jgi:hypothetical protein
MCSSTTSSPPIRAKRSRREVKSSSFSPTNSSCSELSMLGPQAKIYIGACMGMHRIPEQVVRQAGLRGCQIGTRSV